MLLKNLLRESLESVFVNEKLSVYTGDMNEVDWEDKFSDAKASCVTPDQLAKEMNDELARLNTAAKDRKKRSVNAPIHTRGNIEKSMSGGELDVEKFKALITAPPKTIFDQNPKMEKTDKGKAQLTVNTGLPAIVGIIYDNELNQFYKINTCPGAGSCRLVCYARKGFYGMNDGKSLKLIQRLNLLMNDPEEYYYMIMDELEPLAVKLKRQSRRSGEDIQLVIRWNDAGDFFSEAYYKIAQRVTAELVDAGFNVKSYAYTKLGKYMDLATSDFVMNFSRGANKREMSSVDIEKVKQSVIVPKEVFDGVFVKKGPRYEKDPETGLPQFVEGGYDELKNRIAKAYKVPTDNLYYLDELPTEQGEPLEYNAIVKPTGDGDSAAQREDVKITFLLIH
jgi:hypothetical protein